MAKNGAQSAAAGIVAKLRAAGYQAYFVGGCVRDLLLAGEPEDFDVATSAAPDVVLGLFEKTFAVGAHFGVVLVSSPSPEESGEEIVTEVATFRTDGDYSDGRRPDVVLFTPSAEEDVRRRDFTINGMLLDPERLAAHGDARAATLDLVGGIADLEAGVIRAIGEPRQRFREDKLRMLRAVRFAARFGFELEERTAAAIRELAPGRGSGEPRAGARRADQDAHRGPGQASLRAAGCDRAAPGGAAGSSQDERCGAAPGIPP